MGENAGAADDGRGKFEREISFAEETPGPGGPGQRTTN